VEVRAGVDLEDLSEPFVSVFEDVVGEFAGSMKEPKSVHEMVARSWFVNVPGAYRSRGTFLCNA
jgi:hypothetical protein